MHLSPSPPKPDFEVHRPCSHESEPEKTHRKKKGNDIPFVARTDFIHEGQIIGWGKFNITKCIFIQVRKRTRRTVCILRRILLPRSRFEGSKHVLATKTAVKCFLYCGIGWTEALREHRETRRLAYRGRTHSLLAVLKTITSGTQRAPNQLHTENTSQTPNFKMHTRWEIHVSWIHTGIGQGTCKAWANTRDNKEI